MGQVFYGTDRDTNDPFTNCWRIWPTVFTAVKCATRQNDNLIDSS